jgi:hypothetical protein
MIKVIPIKASLLIIEVGLNFCISSDPLLMAWRARNRKSGDLHVTRGMIFKFDLRLHNPTVRLAYKSPSTCFHSTFTMTPLRKCTKTPL